MLSVFFRRKTQKEKEETKKILGLEINSYELPTGLSTAGHIRRRAKPQMKEHFLDKWPYIKSEIEITKLLDDYEYIRITTHKTREIRPENPRTIFSLKYRENRPRFTPPLELLIHN